MEMSVGEGGELIVSIDRIVVEGGFDAADLGARIEREIAERRFGPGREPVVTTIAARLVAALEAAGETV
jgi:hypothetical protein